LALVVVACATAVALHRHREDRRRLATGPAEWIWYARAGRKPSPLRFYATRDVRLSVVPRRVEARYFVDPEYALYVNGQRVDAGRRHPGDTLVVADLAPFLRPGANRVAIEASSPDGIGGILFFAAADGLEAGALASSADWRVSLEASSITQGEGRRAIVWGRPPQYPWGYPRLPGPGSSGVGN
ncbi:MAG TPA: hypothetical protein VGG65_01170, partial [Thermoanaerobaculia bacterium]